MVLLSLEGVGDMEEECYWNLGSGSRVLLWYSDDNVWHEAMIGLIVSDEDAYIYTPDHDLYRERLSCKGAVGPVKLRGLGPRMTLPRNLRARAYRFREKVDDDFIRKVVKEAHTLARAEIGDEVAAPIHVVDRDGLRVEVDTFFVGGFIRRRRTLTAAPTQGVKSPNLG